MNAAAVLDSVFVGSGNIFVHQGTITLSDSNGVAGTLELAAELAEDATTASITGTGGAPLSDGQQAPSGLTVTVGADAYALAAAATVQDGALSVTITPAATTTYAAATAVTFAAAVEVDLVALGAQLEVSASSREPGMASPGVDHAATVHVLQSKLSSYTKARLRGMELKIDGPTVPVHDVLDEDPHWALVAGGPA